MEVIFKHGDGSVSGVSLLRSQVCVHVGVELTTQFFDDDGTVGNFNSIEFNEWQLAFGRAELHLMVNILFKKESENVLTMQK